MKFNEYLTYVIVGVFAFDVLYRLITHDWGTVGISIAGLIGWFYVMGYERQEREEREANRDRDQFTV